jgi:hypothetical protein
MPVHFIEQIEYQLVPKHFSENIDNLSINTHFSKKKKTMHNRIISIKQVDIVFSTFPFLD